jgi:hypothetical protein
MIRKQEPARSGTPRLEAEVVGTERFMPFRKAVPHDIGSRDTQE